MAEHTPGPWRMSGHEAGGFRISTDCKEDRSICHHLAPMSPSRGATRSESLANGHLIAAAPDLLAALQNIINGISTGSVKVDTAEDETWANAMHKARAVLKAAKAKGGK